MAISPLVAGYALAVLALVGAAAAILAAAPRRAANRLLALFLVLEASLYVSGPLSYGPSLWLAYNAAVYYVAGGVAFTAVYLLFVGVALETPLVSWLRTRLARALVVAVGGGTIALIFLAPGLFLAPATFDGVGWYAALLPAGEGTGLLGIPVFSFALVASLHAVARAPPGTLARERARAYAWAFGFQDVLLIATSLVSWLAPQVPATLVFYTYSVMAVVTVALLARALLRHQLFDFELKVKWTLSRGTVAAAFVAVFLVAARVVEGFLDDRLGWLAGGAAAGLMLLALAPLQRAADRLAERAMPGVAPTPTYVHFKKLEVYRAAVETAFEEGHGIDARERATLDRLRAKLGVAAEDAAALETEVTARFAA